MRPLQPLTTRIRYDRTTLEWLTDDGWRFTCVDDGIGFADEMHWGKLDVPQLGIHRAELDAMNHNDITRAFAVLYWPQYPDAAIVRAALGSS